ncbi:hypothetical protein LTS10_013248 [Elasticomyces elasticus]|nr:hypothetical protein LTS10_013248 [Elasticomyces elasticus]
MTGISASVGVAAASVTGGGSSTWSSISSLLPPSAQSCSHSERFSKSDCHADVAGLDMPAALTPQWVAEPAAFAALDAYDRPTAGGWLGIHDTQEEIAILQRMTDRLQRGIQLEIITASESHIFTHDSSTDMSSVFAGLSFREE